MTQNMSRQGNCLDNAVAESFFGSLKTERVFLIITKQGKKQEEIFYNNKRRHSYLGNISPKEY